MSNVVYYIGVEGDDHVKIGTTKNLAARLRSLSTARADGDRLTVLATEPGTYDLEQRRHAQFADTRAHGEWFKLSPALQDHIDRLALRMNPAYAQGYDEGYQTALGDRAVVALIKCRSCGEEGLPSGPSGYPGADECCLSCDLATGEARRQRHMCEALVEAFGPERAFEIAVVILEDTDIRVIAGMLGKEVSA